MSIKLRHTERDQTFFCTFTCAGWLPLFHLTDLYDDIYKWFNILISQRHQIVGFVIMPNHLHLLLHLGDNDFVINAVLANGKRFMAYEIIKRLRKANRQDILAILASKVSFLERKRKKQHRVFEISSDIKPCYSEEFLLQKLDYIHSNPVKGKWQLARSPEEFEHSSARFYHRSEQHAKVEIVHYKDAQGSR